MKILTLFFAFLPSLCFSQPAITSADGLITHNGSVIISGSNFGTKTTAAPYIWSDAESGSFDAGLGIDNGTVISTEHRHANSTYSGFHNYDGASAFYGGTNGTRSSEFYISYWFKTGDPWDWGEGSFGSGDDENLSSVKFIRFWDDTAQPLVTFYYNGPSFPNTLRVEWNWIDDAVANGQSGSDATSGANNAVEDWVDDEWHLMQSEFVEASTWGGNDGRLLFWIDGELVYEFTGAYTNNVGHEVYKYPLYIGLHNSRSDAGASDNFYYIDDIYLDHDINRVELGDNSDYAMCTHREIQPMTAHSSTEITITLNQGSFLVSDDAYLFVINESGVASDGSPVTIGSSGSETMTPPTGLTATAGP